MVTRLPLALFVVATSIGCGSAVAPTRSPLTGAWRGTYAVTSCTGGVDFRACSRLPQLGNFLLNVPSGDSTVSAALRLDVPSPSSGSTAAFRPNVPLQVSGSQSAGEGIHLRASAPLGRTDCGAESVTVDWRSSLSGPAMTGTVTVTTEGWYPGVCLPQTFTISGSLAGTSTN